VFSDEKSGGLLSDSTPMMMNTFRTEEKMEYIMIPIPVTAKKVLGKKVSGKSPKISH